MCITISSYMNLFVPPASLAENTRQLANEIKRMRGDYDASGGWPDACAISVVATKLEDG